MAIKTFKKPVTQMLDGGTASLLSGQPNFVSPKFKDIEKKQDATYRCMCCNREFSNLHENFYKTSSEVWRAYDGYFPICKECLFDYYNWLSVKVLNGNKELALKRVAQIADWYVDDNYVSNAVITASDETKSSSTKNAVGNYCKTINSPKVKNNVGRSYIDTILRRIKEFGEAGDIILDDFNFSLPSSIEASGAESLNGAHKKKGKSSKVKELTLDDISDDTINFFGKGFTAPQYQYLQEQYNDWTARYKCESKVQEELFKNLCVAQLNIIKAQQTDGDVAKANKMFNELVVLANIAPNQQKSMLGDDQTFGTLIARWEEEEPIPEPDPKWADVDGIKKNISTWFLGHLCKMFNIDNDWSAMYESEIAKYTAKPPDYQEEINIDSMTDIPQRKQSDIGDSDG